jgi:hypothetical protein
MGDELSLTLKDMNEAVTALRKLAYELDKTFEDKSLGPQPDR